jgi:hypothetical protein
MPRKRIYGSALSHLPLISAMPDSHNDAGDDQCAKQALSRVVVHDVSLRNSNLRLRRRAANGPWMEQREPYSVLNALGRAVPGRRQRPLFALRNARRLHRLARCRRGPLSGGGSHLRAIRSSLPGRFGVRSPFRDTATELSSKPPRERA